MVHMNTKELEEGCKRPPFNCQVAIPKRIRFNGALRTPKIDLVTCNQSCQNFDSTKIDQNLWRAKVKLNANSSSEQASLIKHLTFFCSSDYALEASKLTWRFPNEEDVAVVDVVVVVVDDASDIASGTFGICGLPSVPDDNGTLAEPVPCRCNISYGVYIRSIMQKVHLSN